MLARGGDFADAVQLADAGIVGQWGGAVGWVVAPVVPAVVGVVTGGVGVVVAAEMAGKGAGHYL